MVCYVDSQPSVMGKLLLRVSFQPADGARTGHQVCRTGSEPSRTEIFVAVFELIRNPAETIHKNSWAPFSKIQKLGHGVICPPENSNGTHLDSESLELSRHFQRKRELCCTTITAPSEARGAKARASRLQIASLGSPPLAVIVVA